MPNLDLSVLGQLTWYQFATLALVLSAVRWATATVYAIAPPNVFSWSLAATVLETQVMNRVVPLAAVAFIAAAIPPSTLHDAVWGLAVGFLGLYLAETIKTILANRALSGVDLANGIIPADAVDVTPADPIPDPALEDETLPLDGVDATVTTTTTITPTPPKA